jgi:hypothetical protein
MQKTLTLILSVLMLALALAAAPGFPAEAGKAEPG